MRVWQGVLPIVLLPAAVSAQPGAGVTWQRCQIIRVLPDSRLRVELGGRAENYALEGIALGPPSVSFVQKVASIASLPSKTECSLQPSANLRVRSSQGDAGWVELSAPR